MTSESCKPPELSGAPFVSAVVICLIEVFAIAAMAYGLGIPEEWGVFWNVLFFSLAGSALASTWRFVARESFSWTLKTKRYRKFFQNQMYDNGFVAGRDGKKWDELDTLIRENDDYYRGFIDGTGYNLATRNEQRDAGD